MISLGSLQELVTTVSILLSILPPSNAAEFAFDVASHVSSREDKGRDFIFADCNAVAPATVRHISSLFEKHTSTSQESGGSGGGAGGMTFIDGSIIGGPPRDGYSPTLYISGGEDGTSRFKSLLDDSGITIKVLSGPIGSASALKMSYAALSKGAFALATTSLLGAEKNDVLPDLLAELSHSQPQALSLVQRANGALGLKSYRWVGEMEEIASYLGEAGVNEGAALFNAAAQVFSLTNRDKGGETGRVLEEASRQASKLKEKEGGSSTVVASKIILP